jgi:myo-inositol-1(or 4)-monophosphatase
MKPTQNSILITAQDDMVLLARVIREAGELALKYFKRDLDHWKKSDNTPVCEADIAVNRLLQQRLLAARPKYSWLSEETEDDARRLNTRRVWVVDPIDGTRAFLRGGEDWTISVAIVENGRPITAAVYHPTTARLYSAVAGSGAFVNKQLLATTLAHDVLHCRMAANSGAFRPQYWQEPWPEMTITSYNSMALRLCHVAQGQEDAALTIRSKNDWDLAAADLLVQEAGGKVTTLDGRPLIYNGIHPVHENIAAAGLALHAKLMQQQQIT